MTRISRRIFGGLLAAGSLIALCAAGLGPHNPPISVTCGWNASFDSGLVGYNLYWGASSRNYTNVLFVPFGTNSGTITNLAPKTVYYFAVTATNNVGLESDFSDEIWWQSPNQPSKVNGLVATNAILHVSLQRSPDALAPYSLYADFGAVDVLPGYYRSVVSFERVIQPAAISSRTERLARAVPPPLPN